MKKKIAPVSKALLIVAALALVGSLFVPLWRIYLDAPQYPEGLSLQIWANKIAGDVDIINGLNHYIGMKTLHTEDFIEFTVLPYIIVGFALFFVLVAVLGRKLLLNISLWSFAAFGVVSMVDFWKWEYDYGHNLDPNAAIKVPGMAYQPPLIGFKQLLNFGAFSIPDIGGWLFVAAGVLVLIAVAIEGNWFKKFRKSNVTAVLALGLTTTLLSCGAKGPEPIALNSDACEYCKMSISEGNFAAEIITDKGRVYKFDDLKCMIGYAAAQENASGNKYYVGNYLKENELIDAGTASYVKSDALRSPMGGNLAAFSSQEAADAKAQELQVAVITWKEVSAKLAAAKEGDHEH